MIRAIGWKINMKVGDYVVVVGGLIVNKGVDVCQIKQIRKEMVYDNDAPDEYYSGEEVLRYYCKVLSPEYNNGIVRLIPFSKSELKVISKEEALARLI